MVVAWPDTLLSQAVLLQMTIPNGAMHCEVHPWPDSFPLAKRDLNLTSALHFQLLLANAASNRMSACSVFTPVSLCVRVSACAYVCPHIFSSSPFHLSPSLPLPAPLPPLNPSPPCRWMVRATHPARAARRGLHQAGGGGSVGGLAIGVALAPLPPPSCSPSACSPPSPGSPPPTPPSCSCRRSPTLLQGTSARARRCWSRPPRAPLPVGCIVMCSLLPAT